MAPELDRPLRWWYGGQLIILVLAGMVRLLTLEGGLLFPAGGMILIIGLMCAWWPMIESSRRDWYRLRHTNYYLQTIIQFNLLPLLLGNLVALLSQLPGVNQQGLIAVAMAYMVVMFVPVAYVVTAKIGSLIGRILMLITAVFSGLIGAQATMLVLPMLKVPAAFNMVSDAGILGAFGFVLTVALLMRMWSFRGPTWQFNRQASRQWIAVILIIGLVFSLWNGFSDGGSWATTFTKWDFRMQSPTWKMFLSGLEPGIAEEWLYRFAVLTLLLKAFQHHRWQLDGAVWFSSLLFGCWHLTNAFAGQAWSATVEQMIFAAALGCFLAVAYLYTGSLAVAMVIHGAIDILSMMASGSQTMVKPDAFEWQTIALTVVVFVGLTFFYLTGSRRRTIQQRVNQRLI